MVNSKTFHGLCTALLVGALVTACNRTDGACWAPGQGGAGQTGVGGTIIVGQGGLGDAPPGSDPQGTGPAADPCNAAEGKLEKQYYCNGDVLCSAPDNPGLIGCGYENREVLAKTPAAATAALVQECQASKPAGSTCSQYSLVCGDKPLAATRFFCNGGVTCSDSKGFSDGCTYSGEEVYASDEDDAIDLLVETCEIEMHDKYGNNCQHGGMCCAAGSLTCHKK